MDKRNLNWITWSFIILTVLVVIVMLGSTLHRTSYITLPASEASHGQTIGDPNTGSDVLTVVEVTPETVQYAIATLARPEAYRRTITIEQFWNGGSGTYEIAVTVSGRWIRTDRTMPDGRVRHTITDDETTYIWYNSEETVYTASAGDISADNEQSIPTYEDILELPGEEITAADYRAITGLNCIYVETAETAEGYALRYWVSVDTGLLVAAEKLLDGEPIYRMGAPAVDRSVPTEAEFTLPDGTVLL